MVFRQPGDKAFNEHAIRTAPHICSEPAGLIFERPDGIAVNILEGLNDNRGADSGGWGRGPAGRQTRNRGLDRRRKLRRNGSPRSQPDRPGTARLRQMKATESGRWRLGTCRRAGQDKDGR